MAVVLADDTWEDMTARVQDASARMERGEQYSPPAVWRQLSTPLRHAGAAQLHDPQAFHVRFLARHEDIARAVSDGDLAKAADLLDDYLRDAEREVRAHYG